MGYQYSLKYSETIKTARQLAIRHSDRYASGFITNGRGQHGSWTYLSALPLQLGLVCDRGCKLQKVDNFFVSANIIDLHLVGSGSYIFPLYINQI